MNPPPEIAEVLQGMDRRDLEELFQSMGGMGMGMGRGVDPVRGPWEGQPHSKMSRTTLMGVTVRTSTLKTLLLDTVSRVRVRFPSPQKFSKRPKSAQRTCWYVFFLLDQIVLFSYELWQATS